MTVREANNVGAIKSRGGKYEECVGFYTISATIEIIQAKQSAVKWRGRKEQSLRWSCWAVKEAEGKGHIDF